MTLKSPQVDADDSENQMDISPLVSKETSVVRSDSSQFPFRRPLNHLRGTNSTSSISTTSSLMSNSGSLSSLSSNSGSSQSIPIYSDTNYDHTSGFQFPTQRSVRRALSSNTFNNRKTTMINGSFFKPSDISQQEEDLDSLCVPSPVAERLTPCTESLIDAQQHGSDSENDDSPSLRRDVGSPIQQRVSSKAKATSRAKFRRTHSMFQSSQDYFSNERMATSLINKISTNMVQLSFDSETLPMGNSMLASSRIRTIPDPKNLIPRIEVDEFVNILDGKYLEFFNEIVVIDCRFEYEFNGGHIDGAINISSQSELEKIFLNEDKIRNQQQESHQNRTLLVFHCEFSSYRGPLMANHLRKTDRIINSDNYPNLHYPDILILEGGYKNFFDLQSHRCLPKCYVLMNDVNHQQSCEIQMHRIRRDSKLQSSRGLKKLKSFHIGMPHHALHLRSRSQTVLQLSNSSTTSITSSRPQSIQKTRHSGSIISLSKHHSLKFAQSISTSSLSSNIDNGSDDDLDSEFSNSIFTNRDGEGISSFFDDNCSSSNTLSSFLEGTQAGLDFKFPTKVKTITHPHMNRSETRKPHQDTPIVQHKKQKSSGSLYRANTQPNLQF